MKAPKICVPITGRNEREWQVLKRKAERKADILEFRLDYLDKIEDMEELLKTNRISIATCRPKNELGKFEGSERERIAVLEKAAGFVNYVDIELAAKNEIPRVKGNGAKIIVSCHLDSTPAVARLQKIIEEEIGIGADMCKLIATARDVSDNLKLLELVAQVSKKKRIVGFCMGEKGKISRIASPLFGAEFTFASISGKASAPGQIDIDELREIYRVIKI